METHLNSETTEGAATRVDVTVTYLQLDDDVAVETLVDYPFVIEEVLEPDVPFYRYLYDTVGEPWLWWRRRVLGDREVADILEQSTTRIFVFYKGGKPYGFFELDLSATDAVEIAYFGLMPFAVGKGFGKAALQGAIRIARVFSPRVILNTCSADHPRALDNYLRAGFKVVDRAEQSWQIPHSAGFRLD